MKEKGSRLVEHLQRDAKLLSCNDVTDSTEGGDLEKQLFGIFSVASFSTDGY